MTAKACDSTVISGIVYPYALNEIVQDFAIKLSYAVIAVADHVLLAALVPPLRVSVPPD